MADRRLHFTVFSQLLLLIIYMVNYTVVGHGRLHTPPSRSSMWRFGYKTLPNYNDMELFCGGFTRQWSRNGGNCGICGDPWDAPQPRDNEFGGKYAKEIIVGNYNQGQSIEITIQLTANHNGYFQFRICSADDYRNEEVTQECLDRNLLNLVNSNESRYYLPAGSGNGYFKINAQLPSQLYCSRCVLQWIYVAGNNWGRCEDGSHRVGCGPQEQFRGCADVAIHKSYNGAGTTPSSSIATYTTTSSTSAPTTPTSQSPNSYWSAEKQPYYPFYVRTTTTTTTAAPPAQQYNNNYCIGAGLWRTAPGMDKWCTGNCLYHVPAYCPPTHCICYSY